MSLFVCFEGIDGAGTTSVSKEVTAELKKRGVLSHWTNEPTGGPVGKLIRQALQGTFNVDKKALLGLFMADRWWHLKYVVKPALARGETILCDRYIYSTLVYQSDVWDLGVLRAMATGILAPHLVFILDCPVEEAQRRKTPEKELFDAPAAQEVYRQRYLDLLAYNGFRIGDEKILKIDAMSQDKGAVVQTALTEILGALGDQATARPSAAVADSSSDLPTV